MIMILSDFATYELIEYVFLLGFKQDSSSPFKELNEFLFKGNIKVVENQKVQGRSK